MGMAASQARLLSITSRLHDVEYAAQNLQNAKLQLATQQDAAYEEYLNALDQRTLTFASIDANGNRSDLTATFNNLFSVNAANTGTGSHYALIDSRGRVVVADDLERGYDEFTNNPSNVQNANLFALYMIFGEGMGMGQGEDFGEIADQVLNENINSDSHLAELYDNAINGRGENGRFGNPDLLPGNNNNGSNSNSSTTTEESNNEAHFDNGDGNVHHIPFGSTITSAISTVVDGREPVTPPNPNPTPIPPKPSVFGSIIVSEQVKPPQRGGEADNGGKKAGDGTKGANPKGRGSSPVNDGSSNQVNKPNNNTTVGGAANDPRARRNPSVPGTTPSQTTPPPTITPPATTPGDSQFIPRADEVSLSEVLAHADEHSEEVNQFLNYFFNRYRTEIFNNDQFDASALPDFDYYVRMFNAIQQHGGCISINDFNGPDGSAATNSEWLTAMIESGQLSIEVFNTDAHGNVTLSGIGVDSDSNLVFATTTQIDKRALAKAEAAYEHAMKVIDRKEKKIDNELNKIETERNALTKEYDSVKKVSDDNIERTFGIFS